jgi:hypothetical protein
VGPDPALCISKVARKSDSADMPMISWWIRCWRVVRSYGVADGRSCDVSCVDDMVALWWEQRWMYFPGVLDGVFCSSREKHEPSSMYPYHSTARVSRMLVALTSSTETLIEISKVEVEASIICMQSFLMI